MRKVLLTFIFFLAYVFTYAQEYTISSAGTGKQGEYLVNVVVSTKKKPAKDAENFVKQYAVHGVIFRGLMAVGHYSGQKPIVSDPNIEQTKAEFFNAFWNEGAYKRYVSIIGSSLVVMKNKQTKMYETSATLMVDQASIRKYLEQEGVISGFSNLW